MKNIQSVHIDARRWFQRSVGNTYFSANIYVNNVLEHTIPFGYGYGSHYEDVAGQWLEDNEYWTPVHYRSLWRYCQEHDIVFNSNVCDVERKKDLHNGGVPNG